MWRQPCLLAVVGLLLMASPARAQSANGVYEPFPDQASNQRAQRFVERLAGREPARGGVTARDLRQGLWLTRERRPAARAGAGAPSARADGSAGDHPSLGWIVELALLLALVSVPLVLVAGRRRRGRRLTVALAICAAVALAAVALAQPRGGGHSPAPGATGPAPRDFLGTVSEDAFAGPPAYRDRTLAEQARAGVGIIRQRVDWADIERRPGRYDLRDLDAFVAPRARPGTDLLPVLIAAPSFRPPRPGGGPGKTAFSPPRDPGSLGRFAAVLVRRYGPDGSLWRARP